MTAYLQPGDVIHLAYPISPTLHGLGLERANSESQKFFNTVYNAQGVTISAFTSIANAEMAHPVVIAVFRPKPDAPEAQP